jgi:hypothetical protein
MFIILLLYVWFEHPRHTYGGFVSTFSERGMTNSHFLTSRYPSSTASPIGRRWAPLLLLRRCRQGPPESHSTPRCLNQVPHDAMLPQPLFLTHLADGRCQNPAGHCRSCSGRRPSPAFAWAAPVPDSLWAARYHRFHGPCPALCQQAVSVLCKWAARWSRPVSLFFFFPIFWFSSNYCKLHKFAHDSFDLKKSWNKFCWVDLNLF